MSGFPTDRRRPRQLRPPPQRLSSSTTLDSHSWETRAGYPSDKRMPSCSEFLRTGDTAGEVGHPWFENVRRVVDKGKRFERVRLVDNPPTEGQRYLLACARTNVVAGEDIRSVGRPVVIAEKAGLPVGGPLRSARARRATNHGRRRRERRCWSGLVRWLRRKSGGPTSCADEGSSGIRRGGRTRRP
ncbi:DUF6879 family protein [Kitasatospora sp. NPDC005856]|uniref:DUF6879 family protein n=1 Tax=Kitasatospora sp. NPDC005856 TaxID=3154566 RepID=UPI0033E6D67F